MLLYQDISKNYSFNTGDLVVGKEESNRHYVLTRKSNNFVGKVLKAKENKLIVKIVDINSHFLSYIGAEFIVLSKHFTLLIKGD